ncbi:MAG: DNA replication/repair protein RecF [Spirochaetaceae bacterium]|nr:MAG: DNA replication/repair protein RecF [Spirochaetaceae bacterium]
MGFSQIRYYQFRNIADGVLAFDAKQIFFVGDNGQGKTNLLESFYILCYGSTFRTNRDSLLIRSGMSDCGLTGTAVTDDSGELAIRFALQNSLKSIHVNGSPVQDRKDLIHNLPCIVFCHDDIDFVSGPPERRRWFFNQTLSLYDELFIDVLRRYTRILKNRNVAVREENGDMIDVLDEQLAHTGRELQVQREHAVERFSATFEQLYHHISGFDEPLRVRYRPSWRNLDSVESVVKELRTRRSTDFTMGTTTSGPHRDRFRFEMNGKEFTETASTGQLRLISLILRVAQARFFSGRSGRKPVLLLDDVMLELDPTRRKRFFDALPDYDQAVFTFLPDEQFSSLAGDDTLLYRVKAGHAYGESGSASTRSV